MIRLLRAACLTLSFVLIAVPAEAQSRDQPPPNAQGIKTKKGKPEPGEPIEVRPLRRLFQSTAPLEMTIETDLKDFVRTRKRDAPLRDATLTYTDSAGQKHVLPMKIGTRGNFRLQARNCSFPPVRLAFDSTKGTEFAGQDKIKLVARCQSNDEFEQYILQEYNLYRIYNLLTPYSFHARLARTTFVDAQKKEPSITMWTFMIEDDGDMARRNAGVIFDVKGALWSDLDPTITGIMSLFEYFIGNTDWSAGGLHNVKLVRDQFMNVRPVAYDLDWSGVISARYARPDGRLPIKTVRERLYRGPCMTEDEIAAIHQIFVEKKDAIWALYTGFAPMDEGVKKRTLEYFEDYYKLMDDKRRMKREIIDACLQRGN
jgi:hypothetical protein